MCDVACCTINQEASLHYGRRGGEGRWRGGGGSEFSLSISMSKEQSWIDSRSEAEVVGSRFAVQETPFNVLDAVILIVELKIENTPEFQGSPFAPPLTTKTSRGMAGAGW